MCIYIYIDIHCTSMSVGVLGRKNVLHIANQKVWRINFEKSEKSGKVKRCLREFRKVWRSKSLFFLTFHCLTSWIFDGCLFSFTCAATSTKVKPLREEEKPKSRKVKKSKGEREEEKSFTFSLFDRCLSSRTCTWFNMVLIVKIIERRFKRSRGCKEFHWMESASYAPCVSYVSCVCACHNCHNCHNCHVCVTWYSFGVSFGVSKFFRVWGFGRWLRHPTWEASLRRAVENSLSRRLCSPQKKTAKLEGVENRTVLS